MGEESDVPLFGLDASTRVDGSHSRAIADIVKQKWRDAHRGDLIARRHVGVEPTRRGRGRPRREASS